MLPPEYLSLSNFGFPGAAIRRPVARCLLILLSTVNLFSLRGEEPTLDFEVELACKQAFEQVAPSVLQIETVGGLDRIGRQLLGNGPTSGVVVGADGWILTSSFNFVGRPTEILVTLPNGERVPARIAATDQSCHLTLLKVDASDLPAPKTGSVDVGRVGMWTLAIGRSYPRGVASLSIGILSAVDRIHGKALQTDAKVSPVNYGGPLANLQGEVLGILVPLSPDGKTELAGVEWYDSGIGFAIPMDRIQRVLPRLKSGENLRPGLAGFIIRPSREDETTIERIRRGSPAYQAGIRKGDVILQVDSKLVRRDAQVRQVLGSKYAGENVRIKYRRETLEQEVELTLAAELPVYELPAVGILLAKPESGMRQTVVRAVIPESPAMSAGIQPGDLIVGWNGSPVASSAELKSLLYDASPGDDVELECKRGDDVLKNRIKLASGTNLPPFAGPDFRSPSVPPKGQLNQFSFEEIGRNHWTLEPGALPAESVQGLVVWLHPPGNPMEQIAQQAWGSDCDRRGLSILGPVLKQARDWGEEDLEYLSDLIEQHRTKSGLSRERVILHAGKGTGTFAIFLARKFPEKIGAVILTESDFTPPLSESDPETAVKICVIREPGTSEELRTAILEQLHKIKVPHAIIPEATPIPEGTPGLFPEGEAFRQLCDWADSLDRI